VEATAQLPTDADALSLILSSRDSYIKAVYAHELFRVAERHAPAPIGGLTLNSDRSRQAGALILTEDCREPRDCFSDA